MKWIKVEPGNLPKQGVPVIGFSRSWIDKDFNPCGIRECFTTDAGEYGWCSAKWLDEQDDYTADYKSIPEYWMPMPQQPLNF